MLAADIVGVCAGFDSYEKDLDKKLRIKTMSEEPTSEALERPIALLELESAQRHRNIPSGYPFLRACAEVP